MRMREEKVEGGCSNSSSRRDFARKGRQNMGFGEFTQITVAPLPV